MSYAAQAVAPSPIETRYKGYKFRSRLEARWAVFFDSAGIEWQYEPEGFQSYGYSYLPDFYLPASRTWVEVKGSDQALREDHDKLVALLDCSSPIPGINDSYMATQAESDHARGLLILGSIPERHFGLILHPIIQHHKGLIRTWASFGSCDMPLLLVPRQRSWLTEMMQIPADESGMESDAKLWSVQHLSIKTASAIGPAIKGYDDARQARFEHGQFG